MNGKIMIIPAIDIIDGKCVRLSQGDYSRCRIYCDDPLDMALKFEDNGAEILHLVDLDGAKASSPVNLDVLERIVVRTSLKVEFGGGVKTTESLESVLSSGAFRVVCGSVSCSAPEQFSSWLSIHGGDRIVLGADVRGGSVAVSGWCEDSGVSVQHLYSRFIENGLSVAIVTDISRDGMLAGPSVELYNSLLTLFPRVNTIASGGVSSESDICALSQVGVSSVIVGKAFYEGRIGLDVIQKYSGK